MPRVLEKNIIFALQTLPDMIELAQHIEVLLLENDCVIVPGLGGFIAHNRPAAYHADSHTFEPPMRTVGFNPRLVINDGLLVQSYMQTYNTDFPDATRKIEKTVQALKEQLYRQGHIELNRIGTLYYNMNGDYEFEPSDRPFFTPSLYGLDTFSLLPLQDREEAASLPIPVEEKQDERPMLPLYHWLRNAVALAAAVLLFFVFSTPVENTYMDGADFASLGSFDMFDAIRDRSAATSMQTRNSGRPDDSKNKDKEKRVRNNINTLKPVTVKTETVEARPAPKTAKAVAKAEKKAVKEEKKAPVPAKKPTGRRSYIIVASLTSDADAQAALKKYRKSGYKDAEVVESKGRYRIALCGYSDQAAAYRKVTELRKDDRFKSAWVFTVSK